MKRGAPTHSDSVLAVGRTDGAVEAAASAWVVRRRAGLDAAGEREFAAWLAADSAHAGALARLAALADALQRARTAGATDEIVTQLKIRERRRRSRRRTLAAVGAVAAIVLLAGWWTNLPRAASPLPAVATAAPSTELIRRLPDGSIVELNTGAEIAVKFEPAFRRVELVRGEAMFRVEKDAARPFIVRAAGVDVRAVGTAFSVRLTGAEVQVLVTEGKVGVDDAAHGRSLLPAVVAEPVPVLVAGQTITVEARPAAELLRAAVVAEVALVEIRERLSWRIPRLEFDGVELARAVEQLNRDNRLQIFLEGAAIRSLRISGTFLADDPRTFARLAAASLGLEVAERGEGQIVLRKK